MLAKLTGLGKRLFAGFTRVVTHLCPGGFLLESWQGTPAVRVDSYWNPCRGKWYHTGDTTLSAALERARCRIDICSVPFCCGQIHCGREKCGKYGGKQCEIDIINQTPACLPASSVENIQFLELTLSFFQTHGFSGVRVHASSTTFLGQTP